MEHDEGATLVGSLEVLLRVSGIVERLKALLTILL